MSVFASSLRTNFKRHLRSPALWAMGLAAPIAALYMVPPEDAAYATLTVNGMLPRLTSSVIGLELGVVTATLLTPLAYIYLRSGATKRRPWQVTDVSAASRPAQAIGQWTADTLTLWIILAALTLAGAVLSYFRLPTNAPWNPFEVAAALWLPAAPALALIAAIRTVFDARPLLRRWLGDVLFFILWLAALMMPMIISAASGEGLSGSAMLDAFGFAAPITGSTDKIMNGVTIIGSSESAERISLDAMRGILAPAYLSSRVFWLALALVAAALAGLIYKPRVAKLPKQGTQARSASLARSKSRTQRALSNPIKVKSSSSLVATFISEIRLILRGKIMLIIIAGAAFIGAFLPYQTAAGPAIWLALLFPITAEGGRWHSQNTRQFFETTGVGLWHRAALCLLASITIFVIAHIPSIGHIAATGTWDVVPQMGAIILGVPAAAIALGYITKGPIAGRLILLISWYVYMSAN